MSEQDGGSATALAERYGGTSVNRRRAVIAGSVLLAAVFLGWLVWVIVLSSDPKVTSQLQSYQVTDDHSVSVELQVHLSDPQIKASCTITALAADHTVVGEVDDFTPDGSAATQHLTIRTDRRATAVDPKGCTAPGQSRAR